MPRYLRVYVSVAERRTHAQVEYRRILRACRARQTAVVKETLGRHLRGTAGALAKVLAGGGTGRIVRTP